MPWRMVAGAAALFTVGGVLTVLVLDATSDLPRPAAPHASPPHAPVPPPDAAAWPRVLSSGAQRYAMAKPRCPTAASEEPRVRAAAPRVLGELRACFDRAGIHRYADEVRVTYNFAPGSRAVQVLLQWNLAAVATPECLSGLAGALGEGTTLSSEPLPGGAPQCYFEVAITQQNR